MTYEIRTLEKLLGKTYKKSYLTNEYTKVNCKKVSVFALKQMVKIMLHMFLQNVSLSMRNLKP